MLTKKLLSALLLFGSVGVTTVYVLWTLTWNGAGRALTAAAALARSARRWYRGLADWGDVRAWSAA